MKFDEKLQKLRKASNLSQEQLADKLGVSRQAVSKWESGASYPEMDKLIQMSKIFNCSLDDLVNDEESDKTIFKNNASKRNLYVDSFMEFITKSVNMFSKMKFLNFIKCICELIIIAFVIGIVVLFISFIIEEILREILFFSSNETIWEICNVIDSILSSVFFIVLIIIGIIVFIQIYKIRYLDYYDKLMYEYEQREELESNDIVDSEEVNEDKKQLKVVKKRERKKINLADNKRERIVIRDPEHRPFAFLSILSNLIINIFKCCLLFISFGFVFLLILLVVGIVLSIYLISVNKIFVGVVIAILGAIGVNLVILDWNFKFIHSMKIYVRRLFIISVICVIVSSIGAGIFIIGLKDINFIEYGDSSEFKRAVEVIPSDKKIYLVDSIYHYNIMLEKDELINDYQINFEYNYKLSDYTLVDNGNGYQIDFEFKTNTIKKAIDFTLEGFRKNEIRLFDLYSYPYIVIKGNPENIDKLIQTLRDEQDIIYVDMDNDGIYVVY